MAGRSKKSMFDDIKEIETPKEPEVKVTKVKKEEKAAEPKFEPKTGIVKTDSWLNVRAAADISSAAIGQLKNGEKITIYEEKNGFGRISDFNEMWVKLDFVTF